MCCLLTRISAGGSANKRESAEAGVWRFLHIPPLHLHEHHLIHMQVSVNTSSGCGVATGRGNTGRADNWRTGRAALRLLKTTDQRVANHCIARPALNFVHCLRRRRAAERPKIN